MFYPLHGSGGTPLQQMLKVARTTQAFEGPLISEERTRCDADTAAASK
jgi:hypothetical protein